jgi:hypothetical protein
MSRAIESRRACSLGGSIVGSALIAAVVTRVGGPERMAPILLPAGMPAAAFLLAASCAARVAGLSFSNAGVPIFNSLVVHLEDTIRDQYDEGTLPLVRS